CYVENVRVDTTRGTFSSIVMSFDIGSRDSVFANLWVDGGNQAAAGISLESAEGCQIINSFVQNAGTAFFLPDCQNAKVIECEGTASQYGISLESGGGTWGCHGVEIVGGRFHDNTIHGIRIINGSQGNFLHGVVS